MPNPGPAAAAPASETCGIELEDFSAPPGASLKTVWKGRLRRDVHRCSQSLRAFFQLLRGHPQSLWAAIWFAVSSIFAILTNRANVEILNVCNSAIASGTCVFVAITGTECPKSCTEFERNRSFSCALTVPEWVANPFGIFPAPCDALTSPSYFFSVGSPFLVSIYVWISINILDVFLRFLVTLNKNVRMPRTICVNIEDDATYCETAIGAGHTAWVLYDAAVSVAIGALCFTTTALYTYSSPLFLLILRSPHFLSALPITIAAMKSVRKCGLTMHTSPHRYDAVSSHSPVDNMPLRWSSPPCTQVLLAPPGICATGADLGYHFCWPGLIVLGRRSP